MTNRAPRDPVRRLTWLTVRAPGRGWSAPDAYSAGRAPPPARARRGPARAGAFPGARGSGRGPLAEGPRAPGERRRRAGVGRRDAGPGLGAPQRRGVGPGQRLPGVAAPAAARAIAQRRGGELRRPAARGHRAVQRERRAHAVDGGVGGGGHPRGPARAAGLRPRAGGRSLPFFARGREAGRWSSATHSSLVGARVLVVGAGDIGRAIGRMMAGFDVDLTYVARTARDGVRSTADLPRLLPDADVVIVVVPLTPETRGMVDAGFLAAMKDGALLVNAARGVIVDTAALLAELTAGRLRAAVDVTDPEPLPEGHPLWSAPGLLLTPHVGGAVPQTNARAAAAVVDQIGRILAGEPLANEVHLY